MIKNQVVWSKKNGYECSSKGDKRFSAFYARLKDGRTIEEHYQCDVKGYDVGGTNWKLGKGHPPLDKTINLFEEYLKLWIEWATLHKPLMKELNELASSNGNVLSDRFATTEVNQAHALSILLNDLFRDIKMSDTQSITIYTDGSARPNPGAAGYGFCAVLENGDKYSGGGPIAVHNGTNNIAEILAVPFSVLQIRKLFSNISNIIIKSDSQYVIKCILLIPRWKAIGWIGSTGTPVANVEIWKFLDKVITEVKNDGIEFDFEWVRGHNGIDGNEIADVNANKGREIAVKLNSILNFELSDNHFIDFIPNVNEDSNEEEKEGTYIGTTSPTVDSKIKVAPFTKLFSVKRWFFITLASCEIEKRLFYFGSTYEDKKGMDNKNLGKRASDTMYALYFPKEQIKELDTIRDKFNSKCKDISLPVVVNLTKLLSLKTWTNYIKNPNEYITFPKENSFIAVTTDGILIGNALIPPKLSFKLSTITTLGYEYFTYYMSKGNAGVYIYDITNDFYEEDKKGIQKVRGDFSQSIGYIDIDICIPYLENGKIKRSEKPTLIRLTVDIDIPNRNAFSGLVKDKEKVKVSLLVTESFERSCRIAVILEQNENVCIYYSADANFRIKG
jgi:ribonuclease HI